MVLQWFFSVFSMLSQWFYDRNPVFLQWLLNVYSMSALYFFNGSWVLVGILPNVYANMTQCSPLLVVIPKTTHPSSKALYDKAITVRVK
jgi:hypothetical protein